MKSRRQPISHLGASVISIRKYLQADRRIEDTLAQLAQLLIDGMDRHAVEAAPGELDRLRETTQPLLAGLESNPVPDDLLEQAALAMEALHQYNQNAVEYLRRPIAELQAKVRMLTAAITAVSSTSHENIRRLREIKSQMLLSIGVKEIRSLRGRLYECLDGVLAAAERQREETDRATEHLHRTSSSPAHLPDAGQPAAALDPATGLAARDRAEDAIAQACQNADPAYVVVMVINQVQTLSRSFGDQFGDGILRRFAGFVRREFLPADEVFRWSGPTVVALVRRSATLDTVRFAMDSLLAKKVEHTASTGTRDVQVPISARWTVLPLMASPRLLFHKMDSFAGLE
jgi:GGDEF domain-containing protein